MQENRLQSILHIAESRENAAARVFVAARKNWQSNQVKLNELLEYRAEYNQRDARITHCVQHFQSARMFLLQLSAAIDQQEQQLERTRAQMDKEKELWVEQRISRRTIELLKDKQTRQFEMEQRRQEQKEQDENSLHPSARNNGFSVG